MKPALLLILFLALPNFLANGSPLKPSTPPEVELLDIILVLKAAADKLESFPWIKASKAKARFGTTTPPPCTQASPTPVPVAEVPVANKQLVQPQIPALTTEMVENYIETLLKQLQPYIVDNGAASPVQLQAEAAPTQNPFAKKLTKGKSSKLKVRDASAAAESTTEAYWMAEKKLYPDSFYDEFYLDWLRKRQVEDMPLATPNPLENVLQTGTLESSEANSPPQPQQSAPSQPQMYPGVPLTMNPYMMNPFMYPLASFKVSKAMAQAQVNAALAALNITTTPKPVKIKLKIPIPGGSDLAQVVASGIAGFPAGTTYELSKKK